MSGNIYLVQSFLLGILLPGLSSTFICHVLAYISELGNQTVASRLLLPMIPLSICAGGFSYVFRARTWLQEATRELAKGGHSDTTRQSLLHDILDSAGLQAFATGTVMSTGFHFMSLAAPHHHSRKAIYTYDVTLWGVLGLVIALMLVRLYTQAQERQHTARVPSKTSGKPHTE